MFIMCNKSDETEGGQLLTPASKTAIEDTVNEVVVGVESINTTEIDRGTVSRGKEYGEAVGKVGDDAVSYVRRFRRLKGIG